MNAGGFGPAAGNAPRGQGPYSPPGRQGNHGQGFVPPAQRGGRGGRNGNANFHRMSLPNSASRVPPVQTQFGPYDYPVAPMSAMQYQAAPQWDNPMVIPMLKQQLEYYFSVENLCKDLYLRKHMDSQGFVPLHFVAGFQRLRMLSGDINLIRAICEDSAEIEYVVGDDDTERLRRVRGWEKFVLAMEAREELARNPGPANFTPKTRSYMYGPQYGNMHAMQYGMSSPPAYYGHGEQPMQHFPDEHFGGGQAANGMVNGHGGMTQLSADVPDFSPSGPGANTSAASKSTLHPEAAPMIPESVNGQHSQDAVNGLPNGVHAESDEAPQS
jgi:la-related protein 1